LIFKSPTANENAGIQFAGDIPFYHFFDGRNDFLET
jgi:hypothetical protein